MARVVEGKSEWGATAPLSLGGETPSIYLYTPSCDLVIIHTGKPTSFVNIYTRRRKLNGLGTARDQEGLTHERHLSTHTEAKCPVTLIIEVKSGRFHIAARTRNLYLPS